MGAVGPEEMVLTDTDTGSTKAATATKSPSRCAPAALLSLGILILVVPFFFARDFTPDLGIAWNLRNMEVVLLDTIDEYYMNINEFRDRYPTYADMSEGELTRRLHAKYFSGMTLQQYKNHFLGAGPGRGTGGAEPTTDDDIADIRGDFEDINVEGPLERAVMTQDAMELGLLRLTRNMVSFKCMYSAMLGLFFIGLAVVVFFMARAKTMKL